MKNFKSKFKHRQSKKAGLAPGTPVFIGEDKPGAATIEIVDYNADKCQIIDSASPEQCLKMAKNPQTITWVNICGVHDVETVLKIAKLFNFHPLTVEDIVNTLVRPKAEFFSDYLFFVQKQVTYNADSSLSAQQVSLVIGENFVLSFLEVDEAVFEDVKTRIISAKGQIRTMKSDYLLYALMDALLDKYYFSIEQLGDTIELVDDKLMEDPQPYNVVQIHNIKRDLMRFRKSLWPLREEIATIEKSQSKFMTEETRFFFRDIYNHAVQLIEITENLRELLGSMHDTYLSSVSNRMNEIMKVLTIIATIFIPLTFIAGVYGMNFEHMPELKWKWGYFVVLGVMFSIAGVMLIYFKRKKWF